MATHTHDHHLGATDDQAAQLARLDPVFAGKVDRVLQALRAQGWRPYATGYRDAATQAALYKSGASKVSFSFHQATDASGRPAALAVDVFDVRWRSLAHEQRAAFFRALGAAAQAEGCSWGGAWNPDATHGERGPDGTFVLFANPPYSMGWDPAHIQLLPNSALAAVKKVTLAASASGRAGGWGPTLLGGLAGLLLMGLPGLLVGGLLGHLVSWWWA